MYRMAIRYEGKSKIIKILPPLMDLFELRSGKDEKSFLLYNFKASFLSFTVDTQSSVR